MKYYVYRFRLIYNTLQILLPISPWDCGKMLKYDSQQGKNITLPERPWQANFDCRHVDFCCTSPVGMYFLLTFGIKNFTNHTMHTPLAYCQEIENFGHKAANI